MKGDFFTFYSICFILFEFCTRFLYFKKYNKVLKYVQLTVEQRGFELHRSASVQIFFNK